MIALIVTIALVGLLVWALTALVPMPPQFQTLIYVVCVIGLALYALRAFGLWRGGSLP